MKRTLSATRYIQEMAPFNSLQKSESIEPAENPNTKKSKNPKEPKSSDEIFKASKYTTEQLLQLVELIKQQRILWDKRSKGWSDNTKKSKIWKEIDKKMADQGVQIDSRVTFNALKSKFNYETKAQKSLSGSSPKSSKWPIYESMKFVAKASDDSNLRSSIGFSSESEPFNRVNVEQNEFINDSPSTSNSVSLMSSAELSNFIMTTTETKFKPTWKKNSKACSLMEPIAKLQETVEVLKQLKESTTASKTENSIVNQHLKLISMRIESLPSDGQKRILKLIDDALYEEENNRTNYYLVQAVELS